MKSEDRHIIISILDGDTESFRILMNRYSSRVFAMIVRIVGDECDAEELTQDTFINAYKNLSRFDGRSAFSTWLYRIAYNVAVSHYRKGQSNEICYEPEVLKNICDDEIEHFFESDDPRLTVLPMAINRLNIDERSLLTMFYYDEMPLNEAAVVLGISESNAKVKLMRIRRKLYSFITEITSKQ